MTRQNKQKKLSGRRLLRNEQLENRQMLHGGSLGAASLVDRVEAIYEKMDEDGNGEISAGEVSDGAWSRLSGADADESGGVSQSKLVAQLEAKMAEHQALGARHGRKPHGAGRGGDRPSVEERVDRLFESAGDDGLLGEDEVSSRMWSRISDADSNADGFVSEEELTAKLETALEERITARIDRLFEADVDDNGLAEDEVSDRKWSRLSQADADEDGTVTRVELRSHIEEKHAGQEDGDGDDDGEGEVEDLAQAAAAINTRFTRRGGRGAGRRR